MVFGDENYEGKLKYSLEQRGLVSQFSRWIVDRIVKREMRILMLGLDNSGKTSILYRLKLGKPKRTVPTGGGAVATIAALATNETTIPSRMAAPPQVLSKAARCAGDE